jgi:hypothetical protein
MQFGRALRPDDLRAVHFVIDQDHADKLAEDWRAYGLATIGLELIDCPDRRLTRSAVTAVAHELDSGDAEVCVLLPERMYNGVWHRILHDQTAESIAREIQRLPHANVTTVPFHFDEPTAVAPDREPAHAVHTSVNGRAPRSSVVIAEGPDGAEGHVTPIADVRWRQRVRVHGRVQALRVEPMAGSPTMECTLVDETGGVSIVFFGRRHIDGVEIGAVLTATGMAIEHRGRLAIVNPVYELR